MRVRIIFRGLTLFTFEKEADPSVTNQNRGRLTAHLVSHGEGQHKHRPKLQIFGRDTSPNGSQHPVLAEDLQGKTVAMKLEGHTGTADGVKVLPSFLDYVPDLGLLIGEVRPHLSPEEFESIKRKYVAATVVIENGEIRSRDFVSWDWHGNGPAPVAYMGTSFRGFAASEVVVDVGDDSEGSDDDDAKYLSITSKARHLNYKCFPLARNSSGGSDDVSPNTVEVSITNFAHQRPHPLYWNMHYQWLFAAAGFEPRLDSAGAPLYAGSEQYVALKKAAQDFDKMEWDHDFLDEHQRLGHPFPFILDRLEPLAPIAEFREPYVPTGHPPFPPGTGHDPNSRPICPFGHI